MRNLPHNPPNMCTQCGGYNYKAPKVLNPKKCNCKKLLSKPHTILNGETNSEARHE